MKFSKRWLTILIAVAAFFLSGCQDPADKRLSSQQIGRVLQPLREAQSVAQLFADTCFKGSGDMWEDRRSLSDEIAHSVTIINGYKTPTAGDVCFDLVEPIQKERLACALTNMFESDSLCVDACRQVEDFLYSGAFEAANCRSLVKESK